MSVKKGVVEGRLIFNWPMTGGDEKERHSLRADRRNVHFQDVRRRWQVGVGEDADAVKMMEIQACLTGSRMWPECEERSSRGEINIELIHDRGRLKKCHSLRADRRNVQFQDARRRWKVGVGEDADAVKMMEIQACLTRNRVWPEFEERSS